MLFYFVGEVFISPDSNMNIRWKQNGITIAGENGKGNQLNQLSRPQGIYIDDDNQCIYIVDHDNDRIVEWKFGANNGKIVAGGNGEGNRMDQLNKSTDVIVDKKNDSLIICDCANRRVIRWPRQSDANGQIIISDIECCCVKMDHNENLYISNWKDNEVRRWRIGETNGTLIAGGNGKGDGLNQLNCPTFINVDEDYSVYVTDRDNHRVMRWLKNAKEGVIVAGGQDEENNCMQLARPQGILVDSIGNVYVADSRNHRIIGWSPGAKQGSIVVGGNGRGQQPNQFNFLRDLSFDQQGNLYVVDNENNRIQKFTLDTN